MVGPVSHFPPAYEPFPPRHVEPAAPPEPTRDAPPPPTRCVCPADLLETLPGDRPFDTHLRIENARADLIRRLGERKDAPTPSSAPSPRSQHAPNLGGVTPVETTQIQRRLLLTYRFEQTFRAGVIFDIVA